MKPVHNSTDILSKHLATACPEGVLDVIGIQDANVVRALPTELDEVVIRQQFTDIVFEQDNGYMLHLEFQTTKESSLYRFFGYDVALAEHFTRKIRTIVLYSGDIRFGPEVLDIGTATYRVENIYLNQLSGDDALDTVQRHLATKEWTPQDRVRLAFAFHMRFEKRSRDDAFDQVLQLTRMIPDEYEQNYVTALILGLSGRSLTKEQESRLKGMMKMTNVVREIEQEARQEGEHIKAIQVAEKMFRKGATVSDVVDITGLSEQEAEEIQRHL